MPPSVRQPTYNSVYYPTAEALLKCIFAHEMKPGKLYTNQMGDSLFEIKGVVLEGQDKSGKLGPLYIHPEGVYFNDPKTVKKLIKKLGLKNVN